MLVYITHTYHPAVYSPAALWCFSHIGTLQVYSEICYDAFFFIKISGYSFGKSYSLPMCHNLQHIPANKYIVANSLFIFNGEKVTFPETGSRCAEGFDFRINKNPMPVFQDIARSGEVTVSYTHLTLPTIYS